MESNTTRTTVPAAPGWYVALFHEAGEIAGESWGDYFSLDPIIAWEIEREDRSYVAYAKRPGERCVSHHTIPITLEGNMNNTANDWAIKRPDGKFEFVGDQTCDTESDAVAVCRALLAYRKTKAAV